MDKHFNYYLAIV